MYGENIMNDRLHEIIAQCAVLHEEHLSKGIIYDLYAIECGIQKLPEDVQNHYLTLLMQYYFQKNYLKGLKKLLLQGFKFDLRFEDIKEAFLNIKEHENNVIEFFDDSVVMLKDVMDDAYLVAMYEYFQEHEDYQHYLEPALELIKRNRYVCAHAYKSKLDCKDFFINEDLLVALKEDLPYLFK
jgi:hypothetical protein